MKKIEINKIIQLIVDHVPPVRAIYLFGSQAEGSHSLNSDVDIAFLTPYEVKLSNLELYNLKSKIEIALNKDADLIHLNQATLVLQFQITTTGIPIYGRSNTDILEYEALILSMYQRLQEERKDILNEIVTSGKVYG
ncbi:MAG: nucleotidyltransferase domain-containing protein [Cyclobacteriaceae bacterium]|nr:nucleotidyltransferase domain-containing protein [Cyclobacteriaceae bacterium]